jgi:tetratricopeptide (TPR) repeat protein
MRLVRLVIVALALALALTAAGGAAHARKGAMESEKPKTAEEAIGDAEHALEVGAVGDAMRVAERLQKTRGLTKEQQQRTDLIVARCGLITGKYDASEKILARLRKGTPDDLRLTEWYARALDGAGRTDAALALFTELAAKDQLSEGDSYWALAQLEHKKGDDTQARAHAEKALEKPIILQSDELDREIHKFIDDLAPKKK